MTYQTEMTETQARVLASWDEGYRARKINGRWFVWQDEANHVVEFKQSDIDAVA